MQSLTQVSMVQVQKKPKFGNYKKQWRAYFKTKNRNVSLPATPVYSRSLESLFNKEQKTANELFEQNPDSIVSREGQPIKLAKESAPQRNALFNIRAWRNELWEHFTKKQEARRKPTDSTAGESTATGYEREAGYLAEQMQISAKNTKRPMPSHPLVIDPQGDSRTEELGKRWELAHDNHSRKTNERSREVPSGSTTPTVQGARRKKDKLQRHLLSFDPDA